MKQLATLAFVLLANPLFAQSQATPTSKLGWDQPGVANATEATGFTYKGYFDSSPTGVVLTNVACTGTTTISCTANLPAQTGGNHSVQITGTNAAGEGLKSSALPFQYITVPLAPVSLKIVSLSLRYRHNS